DRGNKFRIFRKNVNPINISLKFPQHKYFLHNFVKYCTQSEVAFNITQTQLEFCIAIECHANIYAYLKFNNLWRWLYFLSQKYEQTSQSRAEQKQRRMDSARATTVCLSRIPVAITQMQPDVDKYFRMSKQHWTEEGYREKLEDAFIARGKCVSLSFHSIKVSENCLSKRHIKLTDTSPCNALPSAAQSKKGRKIPSAAARTIAAQGVRFALPSRGHRGRHPCDCEVIALGLDQSLRPYKLLELCVRRLVVALPLALVLVLDWLLRHGHDDVAHLSPVLGNGELCLVEEPSSLLEAHLHHAGLMTAGRRQDARVAGEAIGGVAKLYRNGHLFARTLLVSRALQGVHCLRGLPLLGVRCANGAGSFHGRNCGAEVSMVSNVGGPCAIQGGAPGRQVSVGAPRRSQRRTLDLGDTQLTNERFGVERLALARMGRAQQQAGTVPNGSWSRLHTCRVPLPPGLCLLSTRRAFRRLGSTGCSLRGYGVSVCREVCIKPYSRRLTGTDSVVENFSRNIRFRIESSAAAASGFFRLIAENLGDGLGFRGFRGAFYHFEDFLFWFLDLFVRIWGVWRVCNPISVLCFCLFCYVLNEFCSRKSQVNCLNCLSRLCSQKLGDKSLLFENSNFQTKPNQTKPKRLLVASDFLFCRLQTAVGGNSETFEKKTFSDKEVNKSHENRKQPKKRKLGITDKRCAINEVELIKYKLKVEFTSRKCVLNIRWCPVGSTTGKDTRRQEQQRQQKLHLLSDSRAALARGRISRFLWLLMNYDIFLVDRTLLLP
ncbi:Hypothetical predicted protein, partial [Drosophila guanche]